MMAPYKTVKNFRFYTHSESGFAIDRSDLLREVPLEIIINNQSHVLIMFTPHRVKELVFGFIFTEGLIRHISEIERCDIDLITNPDGEETIEASVTIPSENLHGRNDSQRRVSYSSCGICGKDSAFNLESGLTRVKSRCRFSMDIIKQLPKRMLDLQPLYKQTRGAHAAMLFDADGTPVAHCEDMGRHNALDKVIGTTLIDGIPAEDKILFSSGRASLEMILKTARIGFPVFVAKSRPTSKAVEAAKFYNITLIDLAANSNRIYSHARRLKGFE